MLRGSQVVPLNLTFPGLEVRRLRAALILEECLETIEALGFFVSGEETNGLRIHNVYLIEDKEPIKESPASLIEVVDGCCDISVVTIGTLSAFGVPDLPVLNLVDQNNLAKFGPGCTIAEGGKVIKPPHHKKPNFSSVLFGY